MTEDDAPLPLHTLALEYTEGPLHDFEAWSAVREAAHEALRAACPTNGSDEA